MIRLLPLFAVLLLTACANVPARDPMQRPVGSSPVAQVTTASLAGTSTASVAAATTQVWLILLDQEEIRIEQEAQLVIAEEVGIEVPSETLRFIAVSNTASRAFVQLYEANPNVKLSFDKVLFNLGMLLVSSDRDIAVIGSPIKAATRLDNMPAPRAR